MSLIRITKEFKFEMAHALYGYDGPCKNIHGHSYILKVCVLGKVRQGAVDVKNGMVMDFGDLKQIVMSSIVNELDHALVLNDAAPKTDLSQFEKVVYLPYQPTSENMVLDFVERIQKKLPSTLRLQSVRLHETATAYAEWNLADNN